MKPKNQYSSIEEKCLLTKLEQKEILGGVALFNEIIDIDNENGNFNCTCTYKNHSVVNNVNAVTGCACLCV